VTMTIPTNAAKIFIFIWAYSNRKRRARQARFAFPAAQICNFQAAPVLVNNKNYGRIFLQGAPAQR
jgi:hypothetical protein